MPAVEFRLPDVGEGIHEAEIVKWLVQEGERVKEFEPMVEVQTDKALVELPAPATGYIGEILATPGTMARVGDVLVVIDSARDANRLKTGAIRVQPAAELEPVGVGPASVSPPLSSAGSSVQLRPKATPGVRYYARQQGVDLTGLVGTGPSGRITKADVDRERKDATAAGVTSAAEQDDSLLWSVANTTGWHHTATARGDQHNMYGAGRDEPVLRGAPIRVPFRGIRRATAEHVKRSAFTAPHVTAFDECDASALVVLRNRWNAQLEPLGKRVSYLPFLIKATVSALRAFPYFNARLDEDAKEIELIPEYHIGIAVDTSEGLFVPVIRHADQLTVGEIGETVTRLTEGVKNRSLGKDELRGSTFTITNMGPIGGLFATPILNYPEVGILAVHQIQRKPVVREEQVVIRDVLSLSLSFDHRVIDGATSVRFMNHLKHLIENPELLILELK